MTLSVRVTARRGTFVLDVDLAVGDGEVVAVLGPNGAGKTTLLRVLAGLQPIASGTVDLGGRRLADAAGRVSVPPADRRVGMVFADSRLFPHLSARDNVAFGPRSTGTPRAAARAGADTWLSRLDVGDLAGRRPDQLSGGQAQRVALARALVTDPDLLLLDEPLAALDARTRDSTRQLLRRQLTAFGGPALVVTHDLLDSLVLADRVVVLEDGVVVQDDAPVQLTRRPRTPYVARLVGRNLLAGTAERGVLAVDRAGGGGALSLPDHRLRGRVLAAVRPGAVTVIPASSAADHPAGPVDPAAGGASTRWRARVRSTEELGGRVRVHLAGAPGIAADLDPVAAAALQPGVEVHVEVRTADVEAYPAV